MNNNHSNVVSISWFTWLCLLWRAALRLRKLFLIWCLTLVCHWTLSSPGSTLTWWLIEKRRFLIFSYLWGRACLKLEMCSCDCPTVSLFCSILILWWAEKIIGQLSPTKSRIRDCYQFVFIFFSEEVKSPDLLWVELSYKFCFLFRCIHSLSNTTLEMNAVSFDTMFGFDVYVQIDGTVMNIDWPDRLTSMAQFTWSRSFSTV